eukprot:9471551-Pyramimonas_sp.AAC.1
MEEGSAVIIAASSGHKVAAAKGGGQRCYHRAVAVWRPSGGRKIAATLKCGCGCVRCATARCNCGCVGREPRTSSMRDISDSLICSLSGRCTCASA